MGIFSSIGKAIKSVFKGIGKVFKAVAKGVQKLFSSKFGKILLIAAAVFFGGAAIGLWANPFAATAATTAAGTGGSTAASMVTGAEAAGGLAEVAGIPGAAASGLVEGAVTGAAGVAESLAPVATAGIDSGGTILAGTGAASPGVASSAISGAASSAAGISPSAFMSGEMMVNLPSTAAQYAAVEGAGGGLSSWLGNTALGKAAASVGGWLEAHPTLTMIGGNMLSSMFSKSPYEQMAEEKIEYEEWLRKNSTFAGVGYDGSGAPGTDLSEMESLVDKYGVKGPPSQYLPSQSHAPRTTPYVPTQYNPAMGPMPLDPKRQGLLAKYYGG